MLLAGRSRFLLIGDPIKPRKHDKDFAPVNINPLDIISSSIIVTINGYESFMEIDEKQTIRKGVKDYKDFNRHHNDGIRYERL
jgi:hypothetical protein